MILYNEIEPHAAAWLRNLIALGELPDGVVDERSIVDVRGDDLAGCDECHFFAGIGVWAKAVAEAERATGHRLARPLATGSCPCQPLSVAGRREGHVDERHLWPAFHRLIAELRPATVLGEQVAGKDGREWMAAVRCDLEASGYAVGCAVLPAGGFGAPHIRYRLFFVAHADGAGSDRQRSAGLSSDGDAPQRHDIDGCVATGVLADAEELRCVQRGYAGELSGPWTAQSEPGTAISAFGPERDGANGRPRAPDNFWADADWLFCRDNKWRPVEPGLEPLVDGSAFRLGSGGPYEGMSRAGMLRGYGNAICLPVARAFVECAMEALDAH